MRSAAQWYLGTTDDPGLLLANEAFTTAVAVFNRDATNDAHKRSIASEAATIADLERAIQDAQSRYEDKTKNCKVHKWLTKLSQRVRYYGNILDVLVQHHPEYVSLAWGAFKLLFIMVENNEKLLTTLSKAVARIADSLPRVELSAILYPTESMRKAVVQLYVNVINFLIRARSWYDESSIRRLINAIARPAELRYDDIIQDIDACTAEIDHLSTAGARAEQRDMHLRLQELKQSQLKMEGIVTEIRQLCIQTQTLNTSGFLDTNSRLNDLQIHSVMDSLSRAGHQDPLKVLSQCQYSGTKSKGKRYSETSPIAVVSRHPKFKIWQSAHDPALIMMGGNYRDRDFIRMLSTGTVKALRLHRLPVAWVLKSPLRTGDQGMATVDIIRNLICQVLRLNLSLHSEKSMSLSCARFKAAETPLQWFDLLASVIGSLAELYLVINIDAIDIQMVHSNDGFSWLSCFTALMRNFNERQVKTNLKVFLLSQGSATLQEGENLVRHKDVILTTRSLGH